MDVFFLISQIDKLCRERKMPKAKFYELAGITASAVSQWRNGKTVPAESTIQRIAKVFDVGVDVLTGEETKKEPTPEGEHPKSKLRSIARLEDSKITPEQDEQIADYIDFLLSKKKDL